MTRPRSTCSSTGVDGVYHLAGQPGVRASFGPDFEHYVRATSTRARGCSRRRRARACASSTRRRPRSTATPRATRPRRTRSRARSRPTASRSSASSTSPMRMHADDRARRGRRPLLHRLRAAPAARHGVHAAARGARVAGSRSGSSATARSRGASPSSPTPSRDDRRDGARAGGELYNIGGGEEATMREAIALAERIAGRELDRRAPRRAVGDVKRTRADVSKAESGARLGADDLARGRSPGPVGMGRS